MVEMDVVNCDGTSRVVELFRHQFDVASSKPSSACT